MMVAPAEADALIIRRRYSAKPDVVFELWTKTELLAKWFRPSAEFTHQLVEVDVRVGGRYRVAFKSPDGRVDVVAGEYLEVESPQRLTFSWMWEPPNEHAGVESRVTVQFTEVDGETELVLTHRIPDKETRESHLRGWTGALEQIPDLICELEKDGRQDA